MSHPDPQIASMRQQLGLEPLPVEGGYFRQTWRGPERPDGRPSGTAIIMMLSTHDGQFSAMHRLPIHEIWLHHSGDPVELLLLDPDSGTATVHMLGDRLDRDEEPQVVVRPGVWMGGRSSGPRGWSLFSCTTTPGFVPSDYEGGDAEQLQTQFPDAPIDITELWRPDAPLRMVDSADVPHPTRESPPAPPPPGAEPRG